MRTTSRLSGLRYGIANKWTPLAKFSVSSSRQDRVEMNRSDAEPLSLRVCMQSLKDIGSSVVWPFLRSRPVQKSTETKSTGCGSFFTSVAAAVAPAPIVGPMLVKFLQVTPPVAAQVVFLAPMDTMKKIKETGTTGGFPLVPYAAMFTSSSLWVCYGFLMQEATIWAPNCGGVVFGAYYYYTFARYKLPDFNITPYYAFSAASIAAIAGVSATLDTATALNVLGLAGNAAVVAMFGGPLATMKTVIDEKSTRSLPLSMAVATTVNCSLWVGYGALVMHDPYIWFCNGLGLASGVAQLSLFAKYGIAKADAAKSVDAEKKDN